FLAIPAVEDPADEERRRLGLGAVAPAATAKGGVGPPTVGALLRSDLGREVAAGGLVRITDGKLEVADDASLGILATPQVGLVDADDAATRELARPDLLVAGSNGQHRIQHAAAQAELENVFVVVADRLPLGLELPALA